MPWAWAIQRHNDVESRGGGALAHAYCRSAAILKQLLQRAYGNYLTNYISLGKCGKPTISQSICQLFDNSDSLGKTTNSSKMQWIEKGNAILFLLATFERILCFPKGI